MRDTIELSREAVCDELYAERVLIGIHFKIHSLRAFEALVRADERNRTWTQEHWTEYERSIAAAEREACAKVCEQLLERPSGYNGTWEGYGKFKTQMTGQECATAIRARGNT